MKLTTAEAIAILTNHLGINVEIVDTLENVGWIVNTETSSGHPYDLWKDDKIEILLDSGGHETGLASDWYGSWDTTNVGHIAKYRKLNK